MDQRPADAQSGRPLRFYEHQHTRAVARRWARWFRTATPRSPPQDGLSWNDLTPKTGLAYDLFGNGHTALKMTLGKYLQGQLTGLASSLNPVSTLVTSATRTWSDTNRNFSPDCDLLNPAATANASRSATSNFGTVVRGSSFDPALLTGWGKRNYNWEFSTSIQQQVLSRMSVDVGYFRRWYTEIRGHGQPHIERLGLRYVLHHDSRGYQATQRRRDVVGPLYNVVPGKFSLAADNYVTLSDTFGKQIQHWNGVDVNVNARLGNGTIVQGGTIRAARRPTIVRSSPRRPN